MPSRAEHSEAARVSSSKIQWQPERRVDGTPPGCFIQGLSMQHALSLLGWHKEKLFAVAPTDSPSLSDLEWMLVECSDCDATRSFVQWGSYVVRVKMLKPKGDPLDFDIGPCPAAFARKAAMAGEVTMCFFPDLSEAQKPIHAKKRTKGSSSSSSASGSIGFITGGWD